MAELKMDLNEFRAVETKRDDALKAKVQLLQQISTLEKELVQVQADKRIILKTVYPIDQISEMRTQGLTENQIDHFTENIFDILRSMRDSYAGKREVKSALANIKFSYANNTPCLGKPEKIEYLNFDDVQRDLREKAEASVSTELGQLREKVNSLTASIAKEKENLETQWNERVEKMTKSHKQQLKEKDNRIETMGENYIVLEEKYIALEKGKKEQSKIEELQIALKKKTEEATLTYKELWDLKNKKPWWHFW
jgi:hypothetical protein